MAKTDRYLMDYLSAFVRHERVHGFHLSITDGAKLTTNELNVELIWHKVSISLYMPLHFTIKVVF